MGIRGTRITRVNLSADRTIAEGQSIAVAGIVVANESSNPVSVDFQTADGASEFTLVVQAMDTEDVGWQFIADGGLKIDGLAANGDEVIVSVWHSSGGA